MTWYSRKRHPPAGRPRSSTSVVAMLSGDRPPELLPRLRCRRGARAGLLRQLEEAATHLRRIGEAVLDPRDVFEHLAGRVRVAQMHMDLAHVARVRRHRQAMRMRGLAHAP